MKNQQYLMIGAGLVFGSLAAYMTKLGNPVIWASVWPVLPGHYWCFRIAPSRGSTIPAPGNHGICQVPL